MFYKGDVWFSLWQGHAYIDLFEMTGDRAWLELAKSYVNGAIRPYQQDTGSWTWIRPDGSKWGKQSK